MKRQERSLYSRLFASGTGSPIENDLLYGGILYLWDVNDERQVLKFRRFIVGIGDKHSHSLNNLKATCEQPLNHTYKLYRLGFI